MSDLIHDGDTVARLRTDLARIRREFESADDTSSDVAEAVGHRGLAERVRAFTHNWTNRRGDLVEQLQTLEEHFAHLDQSFDDVDGGLASSVRGES